MAAEQGAGGGFALTLKYLFYQAFFPKLTLLTFTRESDGFDQSKITKYHIPEDDCFGN
jgi:hypothetical protein